MPEFHRRAIFVYRGRWVKQYLDGFRKYLHRGRGELTKNLYPATEATCKISTVRDLSLDGDVILERFSRVNTDESHRCTFYIHASVWRITVLCERGGFGKMGGIKNER